MHSQPNRPLAPLVLGALGVVYGDIGTSPLYTVKEIFGPSTGVPLDAVHLIGATSTIIWAIMLVVTIKYVALILRADNRGEGGVLALTALASHAVAQRPRLQSALLMAGVCGATLFVADSVITPPISIMGAVEGLDVIQPGTSDYVVPVTLTILGSLFAIQRHGTAFIGRFFGPVIALWFLALSITGVLNIAQRPEILAALNPMHAYWFLLDRGPFLFVTVGAVVLALTGAEALYADMGHFGKRPIRLAWTAFVLPALSLQYLGQGALLMRDPHALDNPFFRMFPTWAGVPALILAVLAAIIASQAVISGAYSMAKQSVQLGYLPRMSIRFTSHREIGQIYIPVVNWLLLAGVVVVVLGFRSSSALAGAYGVAVTSTMLITTFLTFFVVRHAWHFPAPLAVAATAFFIAIDTLLVAGCAAKILEGGWFPLVMATLLFGLMTTWKRGREIVLSSLHEGGVELRAFIESMRHIDLPRAERTAVYLSADQDTVPPALLHNLKHNQVLHSQNILATVKVHDIPWVSLTERATVEHLENSFWLVTLNFGFMETPNVPAALQACEAHGLQIPYFETSYFLSRATVVPTRSHLASLRDRLFMIMARNANSAADYFRLPDNAVVELGNRVQI